MKKVFNRKKVTAIIDLLTYMLNDPALPTLFLILGLSMPFLRILRFGKARPCSLQYCSEYKPHLPISVFFRTHVRFIDSFLLWLSHIMCRKESSGNDSKHHKFPSKTLSV